MLDHITNNPGNRIPVFVKVLGVPAKTIERWIKQLKDEGKIKFVGSLKEKVAVMVRVPQQPSLKYVVIGWMMMEMGYSMAQID